MTPKPLQRELEGAGVLWSWWGGVERGVENKYEREGETDTQSGDVCRRERENERETEK